MKDGRERRMIVSKRSRSVRINHQIQTILQILVIDLLLLLLLWKLLLNRNNSLPILGNPNQNLKSKSLRRIRRHQNSLYILKNPNQNVKSNCLHHLRRHQSSLSILRNQGQNVKSKSFHHLRSKKRNKLSSLHLHVLADLLRPNPMFFNFAMVRLFRKEKL